MSKRGHVYAFRAPGSAEVKVGRTEQPVEKRLKQLNTTGVLEDLEIEFSLAVNDPVAVEKEAHSILRKSRVRKDREFFTSNPKRTREAIKKAALNTGESKSGSGGIGGLIKKSLTILIGLSLIGAALFLALAFAILAAETNFTVSEISVLTILGLIVMCLASAGWKFLRK